MDIKLIQGTQGATVWLNGASVSGAVKGARFSDGACSTIELALEGTAANIATAVSTVERLLVEAERCFGMPNETPVYLEVTLADGVSWQSPIKRGWAELLASPAGRKVSQQGIKVKVERDGYWEKTTMAYPELTNRHGVNIVGTVYNHDDANHDNHVAITGSEIEGDLPAPALIDLQKAGFANAEIFVGQLVYGAPANWTEHIEGETGSEGAGVTSVHTADAACSGGNYDALSWSGTGAVLLKRLALSAAAATAAGGRVFRPVARVRDLITTGEKIWAYWQSGWWDTGTTYEMMQDCEGMLLSTAKKLQVFPPMYIPPWAQALTGSAAAALQLQVQAAAAGAHAINLDFVQLMPMDGWLHLIPVVTLAADLNLTYDCASGTATRAAQSVMTHFGEGPGLWLYPGIDQRLYFVAQAGAVCDITWDFTVSLGYKPRKRQL